MMLAAWSLWANASGGFLAALLVSKAAHAAAWRLSRWWFRSHGVGL